MYKKVYIQNKHTENNVSCLLLTSFLFLVIKILVEVLNGEAMKNNSKMFESLLHDMVFGKSI